jgi:hypothetical protein
MTTCESIEEFRNSLPSEAQAAVDSIGWNHSAEEERKRVEYLAALFDIVSSGNALCLEDCSRLILNAMTLVRDNERLRKRLDDMVMESIKMSIGKVSFRV